MLNNQFSHLNSAPKAAIIGLAGTALSAIERDFFRQQNPLGFILFARNCQSREQIQALTTDLRASVGRSDAPILIDQEGGRVARLRPPLFPECPAAKKFADMAETDIKAAEQAVYSNALQIAKELKTLGISVNCAPVADLLYEGAHNIIGDRSFGTEPHQVATLARSMCEGLKAGGVMPIIKHIPGHGRAFVDSHESLPIVDASKDALYKTDFEVFRQLADMPWAMTAHIIYTAIDPSLPATLSPAVIALIRQELGFKGIIISDDLSMKALSGSFGERTEQSFAAGCDLVLHCNGLMNEMEAVLNHTPALNDTLASLLHKQGLL